MTSLNISDYFLFIGRVERIKGLDVLLKAFELMPDMNLKIAGTGIDLEKYEKLHLENVEFLGFLERHELVKCLASAKAVIVPSQWYETFGMIIAEAYAAHKPVIVGNIGNISELVDEMKTGLKFKYDSVEDLATKVRKFQTIKDVEWEYNAYNKFMSELSPEMNYKYFKDIYDSVVL